MENTDVYDQTADPENRPLLLMNKRIAEEVFIIIAMSVIILSASYSIQYYGNFCLDVHAAIAQSC